MFRQIFNKPSEFIPNSLKLQNASLEGIFQTNLLFFIVYLARMCPEAIFQCANCSLLFIWPHLEKN